MRLKSTRAGRFMILLVLAGLLLLSGALQAEIKIPAVIGSHMVIQQNSPITLWGWAGAGESVTVRFKEQTVTSDAGVQGFWRIRLEPVTADADPSSMTISGSRSPAVTLVDILVGEVWLCSGQSNMAWTMNRTHTPTPEILRAQFPRIRLFQVPRRAAADPQRDVDAAWAACSPTTVRDFSAVGYYFGLEIHRALGVPVGLIDSTWGGTRIEPWTPPVGFQAVSELAGVLEDTRRLRTEYRETLPAALNEWEAWREAAAEALATDGTLPEAPERPRHPLSNQQQPTALYNGMIHPLVPFAIQGAIWYQGEANRDDGLLYQAKMEALIRGWRDVWSKQDLSFFYVQLAPFNYAFNWQDTGGDVPDFYRLPLIWEAQRKTLSLPHTGMAVVTDITNLNDIHPRNKKEVGRRLSLWAQARTYGRKTLVYSGPLYRSMEVVGDRIRLRFDHVGGGLISMDGQPLSWFEIAGPDRIFYKAKAEIRGNNVVVWSPRVKAPSAVRMGWHQLAVPNLGNREGLPASPFRSRPTTPSAFPPSHERER